MNWVPGGIGAAAVRAASNPAMKRKWFILKEGCLVAVAPVERRL